MLKFRNLFFFEFFLNIKNINIIFDFISKIVFAASFHYRMNFIMRFNLNRDVYFNDNKFILTIKRLFETFFVLIIKFLINLIVSISI